jgi:hypothetical protein
MSMKRLGAAIAAFTLAAVWLACSEDRPATCGPADPWCDPVLHCTSADGCPTARNFRCGEATCTDGLCGVRVFQESTSQRRGDCLVKMCSPLGNEIRVADPKDVYESVDPCVVYSCDGDQPSTTVYRNEPAPDGSVFCDEQAEPVACLTTEDCGDPSLVCSFLKRCVPTFCENQVFDPSLGEINRDCGGPCDPCDVSYPCTKDEDCLTNVCGPDKTCIGYNCYDGRVTKRAETDVDCGGRCDPCKDGRECLYPQDCESKVCWAGSCQAPTCFDDTQNGNETDRDCGGPDCHPC